jgi:hypothetical protein
LTKKFGIKRKSTIAPLNLTEPKPIVFQNKFAIQMIKALDLSISFNLFINIFLLIFVLIISDLDGKTIRKTQKSKDQIP